MNINKLAAGGGKSEVIQSLIEDIEKRVADNILEESNALLLKKLITQADDINEAISIASLGTMYKNTGLHYDHRIEKFSDDVKYLCKNEGLSFKTDETSPTHKLIIGDNYEALQNLLITHRGKIDVIYIDPPYGKDSMGEFARTNYNNSITRDNLLSMLHVRLLLARELMSDSGVIFCSIDDKNQAYVKCLFDEVFGEERFVCCFPRVTKKGGKSSNEIAKNHDYILMFVKNIEYANLVGVSHSDSKYCLKDEYYEQRGYYKANQTLDYDTLGYVKTLDYPIEIDGETFYAGGSEEEYMKRHNNEHGRADWGWRWRWSKEKLDFGLCNGFIEVHKGGERPRIYTKTYQKATIEKVGNEYKVVSIDRTKPLSTLEFIDNKYSNDNAKKIIDSLFPKGTFEYTKHINIITTLISLIEDNENSTILDFFAGSGTTGHAVLEMNKQDGGNRKFILCQLNEKTDANPNGIAYDVTAKRLKRIMTGECYDGTRDFKWTQENTPYGGNLDVYEINSISSSSNIEGNTPFDLIDETLYGMEKFTNIADKIEWVCNNFSHTRKYIKDEE